MNLLPPEPLFQGFSFEKLCTAEPAWSDDKRTEGLQNKDKKRNLGLEGQVYS